MSARRELVAVVSGRYRSSGRSEKGRILDELCAVTGWHRKHALRALMRDASEARPRRARCRTYGEPVRDALIALWEASDRLCAKRLRVMIPSLLPALERHGRLRLSVQDRALVLAASSATIDRLLSEVRVVARGGIRQRAGFSSAVRREVAVRTFNDWGDPPPGFCEADLVAHSGASAAGAFVQTLVLVDIATGWTECLPLVMREGALVVQAIERAQALFPWLIRGLDFDNDSAFMNEIVVPWCRARNIAVTRSRAYKKNDQAFVEQKNGAVVRRLVGYGRFEGIGAAQILSRLYAASRLHVNFFQPSFKLKEKRREGAKVIKRYHAPATPLERALMHSALDAAAKRRLQGLQRTLDPVTLLAEVRKAQTDLGEHIDRRSGPANAQGTPPRPAGTAADFARGLGKDWRDGERRAIHRRQYVRRKPAPRRPSMIDPHLAHVEAWLVAEPHLTAVEVLGRLAERAPGHFGSRQLRTVQRLVKAWRTKMAHLLIDGAETMIMIDAPAAIPAGMAAGASTTAAAARAG